MTHPVSIIERLKNGSSCVEMAQGRVCLKLIQNSVKLHNGTRMPSIGLGTWKSTSGQVGNAVRAAIDCGYRHIDCAYVYKNEEEIGKALKDKLDDGTVKREDLFITSKLWNTCHHPEDVMKSAQKSLDLLRLDYLDLYLIHWPMAYKRGYDVYPEDENGKIIFEDVSFTDTWTAMEELVDKNVCHSIGLSNFNQQQTERVLAIPNRIPVAVTQIEIHPWLTQQPMIDFCSSKGIVVTAYSPLGSPDRPWVKDDDPYLMADPTVVEVANRYKKTPAQILIRFAIDRKLVVIPKSVTPERIRDNLTALDFELSPDDISTLLDLNRNYRGCALEWVFEHKDHPFPSDSSNEEASLHVGDSTTNVIT